MTTQTVTLSEFLLARIAEDEAIAIATRDYYDAMEWEAGEGSIAGPVDGPSGYGVVIIDPARVLAECEAKRRIVEDCVAIIEGDPYEIDSDGPTHARAMLAALALPYADHPDFQEAWRV
jgi:hypothetical protein